MLRASANRALLRNQTPSACCERRRRILDVRAADLQEEMTNNAFPFRQLRRRRRQPSEHRRERQRAIKRSAMREQQSPNNVAKNTSDHGGLRSLLAGPEF